MTTRAFTMFFDNCSSGVCASLNKLDHRDENHIKESSFGLDP